MQMRLGLALIVSSRVFVLAQVIENFILVLETQVFKLGKKA